MVYFGLRLQHGLPCNLADALLQVLPCSTKFTEIQNNASQLSTGQLSFEFQPNFLVLCLAHCNKQVQWSRLDQVVFVVFSDSLMTFSISSQPTCASFACDKFSTVVKGRPAGPSIPLSLRPHQSAVSQTMSDPS